MAGSSQPLRTVTRVPLSPANEPSQAWEFPTPSVVELVATVPVRIQPKWEPLFGGPWPESAVVSPRMVSYFRLDGSRISHIDAMWKPASHALVAVPPACVIFER